MPIILKDDVHEAWIDPETPVDDAREMLKEHRDGELLSYCVDRAVNSNRAQGPELIEPIVAPV